MDNNGQQWLTMGTNPRCYMHLWCRFSSSRQRNVNLWMNGNRRYCWSIRNNVRKLHCLQFFTFLLVSLVRGWHRKGRKGCKFWFLAPTTTTSSTSSSCCSHKFGLWGHKLHGSTCNQTLISFLHCSGILGQDLLNGAPTHIALFKNTFLDVTIFCPKHCQVLYSNTFIHFCVTCDPCDNSRISILQKWEAWNLVAIGRSTSPLSPALLGNPLASPSCLQNRDPT